MKKSVIFALLGIISFFIGQSVINITGAKGDPRMVQMMALIGGLFRGVGVALFVSGILILMKHKRKK